MGSRVRIKRAVKSTRENTTKVKEKQDFQIRIGNLIVLVYVEWEEILYYAH